MILFDSSVIIAALWDKHPEYEASIELLLQGSPESCCCSTHSVAEVFSSLTRIPAHPRLNSEAALKMIESTRKNLSWVDLKASDYENALSEAVKKSVIGGTFYDLLHIQCARKVAAERIYTWNTKHFLRIAPDLAPLILSP